MRLLELHAKEMLGMPPEWGAFRFKAMPQEAGEVLYYEVTGAVAPLLASGPRKGNKNWKRRDRATERVANIPVADHDAWTREWEQRTGKCSNCVGEGKVMARWHYKEGTTRKACPVCGGDGQSKLDTGVRFYDAAEDSPKLNGLVGMEVVMPDGNKRYDVFSPDEIDSLATMDRKGVWDWLWENRMPFMKMRVGMADKERVMPRLMNALARFKARQASQTACSICGDASGKCPHLNPKPDPRPEEPSKEYQEELPLDFREESTSS